MCGADSSTTVFLYGPARLSGQDVRIGVHVYKAFTRAQLSAITDRAWKIAPQAFSELSDAPMVVLHYDQDIKKLHVDVPAAATNVRSALDAAGPDGMNLILDALRVHKAARVADALVLFLKRHESALEAASPADVGAVIKDALNAMDAAVYPGVDTSNEVGLNSFFKLI